MKKHFLPLGAFVLLTALPANAQSPADTDLDGLPDAWETSQGLNPNNSADALSDGDGDSLTALVEYALGGSTTADDAALVPELITEAGPDGTRATASFTRRRDDDRIVVLPEFSDDLFAAYSRESAVLKQPPQRVAGGMEQVQYRSRSPLGAALRQFLRVQAHALKQLTGSGLGSAAEITGAGGITNLGPGDFGPGRDGSAAKILTPGKVIRFPVATGGGSGVRLDHGEAAFWYQPDYAAKADAALHTLFSLGGAGGARTLVLTETDRLTLTLTAGGQSRSVSSDPLAGHWRAGEWVYVRITWDNQSSDSLQVFLNGMRMDAGGAAGGWSLEGAGAPTQMFLGSSGESGASPATGCYDLFSMRDHRQAWENLNGKPLLAVPAAFYVAAGSSLSFTPAVLDAADQTLTFSLDPGAPAGAGIHAATGVFTYAPPAGTPPSAQDVWLRVSDDGAPRSTFAQRMRLHVVANDPPSLTNIAPAAQNATPGGAPQVTFDFADASADITTVRVQRVNALGTQSADIPASALPLSGASGTTTLKPDAGALPYGLTTFTVRLRDSQGNESAPVNFTVQVDGTAPAGGAPAITQWTPPFYFGITRPGGPLDAAWANIQFEFTDPENDAERLRLEVTPPSGPVSVAEIPLAELTSAPSWQAAHIFRAVKFTNDSPLGSYQLAATVFDAGGRASSTISTAVTLVDFSWVAQISPQVDSFTPATAAWGDEIEVTGRVPIVFGMGAAYLCRRHWRSLGRCLGEPDPPVRGSRAPLAGTRRPARA